MNMSNQKCSLLAPTNQSASPTGTTNCRGQLHHQSGPSHQANHHVYRPNQAFVFHHQPMDVKYQPTDVRYLPADVKYHSADVKYHPTDGVMPSNRSELMLYRLLDRANLLSYFETFVHFGGDDVQQLCDAEDDEFLEIMDLVGMAKKPLHVRRLQKTLLEWKRSPDRFIATGAPNLLLEAPVASHAPARFEPELASTSANQATTPTTTPPTTTTTTSAPAAAPSGNMFMMMMTSPSSSNHHQLLPSAVHSNHHHYLNDLMVVQSIRHSLNQQQQQQQQPAAPTTRSKSPANRKDSFSPTTGHQQRPLSSKLEPEENPERALDAQSEDKPKEMAINCAQGAIKGRNRGTSLGHRQRQAMEET